MYKFDIKSRNWQKLRLSGFCLDANQLTGDELLLYKQMKEIQLKLLSSWDSEMEKLLGHKLKPFKCELCGRRSDHQYLYELTRGFKENFCYKHYKSLL